MEELKDINVLIIDPAGYSANLLRSIMTSLGLARIAAMVTTDQSLILMRNEHFDIVFCDENAGPHSPIEFVRLMRKDLDTMNVTVPVVLVSAGTNHIRVAAWRDIGGSDVIVKPVSLETVKNRFQTLVLDPRPFVTSKSFIGPDRRHSGERRQFGERRPVVEDRRAGREDAQVFITPSRYRVEPPTSE